MGMYMGIYMSHPLENFIPSQLASLDPCTHTTVWAIGHTAGCRGSASASQTAWILLLALPLAGQTPNPELFLHL